MQGGPKIDKAEARRLKDEELDERERATMRIQRDKQRKQDSNNVIYTLLSTSIIVITMLVVMSMGSGWTFSKITGIGCVSIEIGTSMLRIWFHANCDGKNTLEDSICKVVFAPFNGDYSLFNVQNDLCASMPSWTFFCGTIKNIYFYSWILFGAFAATTILQLVGMLIIWNYWFVSPLPKLKRMGIGMLVLSFGILLGGFVTWTALMPALGLLPAQLVQIPGADGVGVFSQIPGLEGGALGTIVEVKPGDFIPYGWCWIMCIFCIIFIFAQIVCLVCFFKSHGGEKEAVDTQLDEYEQLINARFVMEDVKQNMAIDLLEGQLRAQGGQPGYPMQQQYPGQQPMQQQYPSQPGMQQQQYQGYPAPGHPAQPTAMNYGAVR